MNPNVSLYYDNDGYMAVYEPTGAWATGKTEADAYKYLLKLIDNTYIGYRPDVHYQTVRKKGRYVWILRLARRNAPRFHV